MAAEPMSAGRRRERHHVDRAARNDLRYGVRVRQREDRASRYGFADRAGGPRDVLFEDGAFEHPQHGHTNDGCGIRGGDGLAGAQPEVGIGGAQDDAHHQTQQHRAQGELLHLHALRHKRPVASPFVLWRRHESLAFTLSLSALPSMGLKPTYRFISSSNDSPTWFEYRSCHA